MTDQPKARSEALRRGYGPRKADWFTRGAYCVFTSQTRLPTVTGPKAEWWKAGFDWAIDQTIARAEARAIAAELEG